MNSASVNNKYFFRIQLIFLSLVAVFLIPACSDSDNQSQAMTSSQETSGSSSPQVAADSAMSAASAMTETEPMDSAAMTEETVAEPAMEQTMEPAAEPAMEEPAAATQVAEAPKADGRNVYYTYCAVCHKSGLNAAPKYGNKALWQKRIAQGREVMYKNSIEGLRGMPPRGGIPGLTDEEVKAAVDFMVKGSGGWGDS